MTDLTLEVVELGSPTPVDLDHELAEEIAVARWNRVNTRCPHIAPATEEIVVELCVDHLVLRCPACAAEHRETCRAQPIEGVRRLCAPADAPFDLHEGKECR